MSPISMVFEMMISGYVTSEDLYLVLTYQYGFLLMYLTGAFFYPFQHCKPKYLHAIDVVCGMSTKPHIHAMKMLYFKH